MAASTAQNPSKSSKKKAAAKAAAIERTDSPAPSTASGAIDRNADAQDGFESPYLKEVQKNIRNVNKKLANASKTDGLIAQHAGKSLDDLVAQKIINTDQKAQILKKPALQAQLTQLEEQQTQYIKVHEQYQAKAAADKAELDKVLDKVKAEAVAEAQAGFKQQLHDNLLLLSQFLRLAAYRREEAKEPESDESQAIEGVLLAIYSGDEGAVSSMLKLVEGSEDPILSVPGDQLQTTYANVKALSGDYKTPFYSEGAQPVAETTAEVGTDPTVANASATEIEAGDAVAQVSSTSVEGVTNGIANASVSDDAANAVAESHWDNANDMSESQEWVDVKVPRDPTETETGLTATPAAASNTQSWADEQPDPVPEPAPAPAPADPNEGFHQVNHRQRRPEREGSFRGRGGRGEHRGRGGHRGDGRGRGRGHHRGGPRRNED
jgi:hypothetical protein